MIKKVLRILGIAVVIFVIAISLFVWIEGAKDASIHDKASVSAETDEPMGVSYDYAMQDDKPMIAFFYSKMCSYCEKFMPKLKFLSMVYKDKYNFVMIDADNPKNQKLSQDCMIGYLPTIYIIDPSINNRVLISNTLYGSLFKIREEFDRYLRIRSMIK